MVVENRPGGGTMIGTEAAARAAPDGNTVLLVANSFVVNPALKKQNFDPTTSFDPICQLAATPLVLVVNGDSPYRTLADLLAAARAKPGALSLASGGPASSLHIAFEVVGSKFCFLRAGLTRRICRRRHRVAVRRGARGGFGPDHGPAGPPLSTTTVDPCAPGRSARHRRDRIWGRSPACTER